MANTTVACTNINLLKESQIPSTPSQNELYAVELEGKPATETQLNQKLDLDVSNATIDTKETIVGWGIPDYSRMTNVPFVLDSSWTATYDGILYCWVNNGSLGIFIGGTRIIGIQGEWNSANIVLPKGQTITMDGLGGTLTFVPFASST